MRRTPAPPWRWRLPVALVFLLSLSCVAQTTRVAVTNLQGLGQGGQDATAAIQAAIDALGDAGGTVQLPAGTYVHRGVIYVRSRVTLEGVGPQTVLVAADPTKASVAAVDAVDVTIRNLTLSSAATERLSTLFNHQLTLSGTQRAVVSGVSVDGSAAAGIFIFDSSHVSVSNCTVANTLADGIHTTNGSHDVRVVNNRLVDTGDDAIAVVSYGGEKAVCRDVSVLDNHITRSHSRGLAVVGGSRVSFERNVVDGTRYAGLYAASEDFYGTMASSDIRFVDNELTNVNRLSDSDMSYQGILLSGRPGSLIERVLVSGNRLKGAGFRGLEANAHVVGALIRDNHFADVADIGLALGGRDMVVTGNVVSEAGSYGIAVTQTARGAIIVAQNTVERPNRQGAGYMDAINADASSLDLLVLAGNGLRIDTSAVERSIEVQPGSGRMILGGNTADRGQPLLVGRPETRWDDRVQTLQALPTSGSWRQGDTLLIEEAGRRFGVWICQQAGVAGAAGGATFTALMSLSFPAKPVGLAE